MFDPGAIGTLLIGLDGDPAPASPYPRRARSQARAGVGVAVGVRLAFAAGLRRTADMLEPRAATPARGATK